MNSKEIVTRAFVVKDNKVVLLWRYWKSKQYYIPAGGNIDEGETPEQAIIRELKEELSIDCVITKKLAVIEEPLKTIHLFLCSYQKGVLKLGADEKQKITPDNQRKIATLSLSSIQGRDVYFKEYLTQF